MASSNVSVADLRARILHLQQTLDQRARALSQLQSTTTSAAVHSRADSHASPPDPAAHPDPFAAEPAFVACLATLQHLLHTMKTELAALLEEYKTHIRRQMADDVHHPPPAAAHGPQT